MKLREAQIPILLWLPAAILFHLVTGGGASEVAKSVADRAAIRRFSQAIRAHVVGSVTGAGRATEIEVVDAPPLPPPEENNATQAKTDDADPEEDPEKKLDTAKPPEPKPEAQKPEPKPPEDPKDKPPEPKPAEKPPEGAKPIAKPEEKPPEGPKQPLEPAKPEGRIAIQNDPTLDPNQKDNPDAKRIADNANTVQDETQSKFRSYDQNAPKPTGGGNPHDGPEKEPGNAAEDERGHSVDAPGEGPPKPGEDHGADKPLDPVQRSPLAPEQRVGQLPSPGEKSISPQDAGKGPRLPEASTADGGSYSLNPDGGDDRPQQEARAGRRGKKGRVGTDGMIMPGQLPTKYFPNAYGLQDALGAQNLRAEQERARNVRLNKHRGVFAGVDFKKYRAAIENYDPAVKEGNQTSLNAARVPFASYINRMHNKIHPIFADGFLGGLTSHPDARLADMKLFTHLEIILDGRTGKLITAGIVRPSGVTALEVAALRSVEEASPYGKPPDVIVSPDGRVYLHWEFYRDPYYACTSKFARPYLLKAAPKHDTPAPVPPVAPPPPDDSRKYGSVR